MALKMGTNQAIAMAKGKNKTVAAIEEKGPENEAQTILSASKSDQDNTSAEDPIATNETPEDEGKIEEPASPASETEEPKEETKSTKRPSKQNKVNSSGTDLNYKVIAGCFRETQNLDKRVSLLNDLGYPAFAKELRSYRSEAQGLSSAIVNRYQTYKLALIDIDNLLVNNAIESYLVKKGKTRLDGMTAYITMDISDPMFPRETNIVQWIAE